MPEFLEAKSTPGWLMSLTVDSMRAEAFPLDNILTDSLYYPCAGFDGRPVQFLSRSIHSFIYVDYGQPLDQLMDELNSDESGFLGYEILGQRNVSQRELAPNGWQPIELPSENERPTVTAAMANPFCVWLVFQRAANYDELHGPERFSFVYLSADGAAAYQALFTKITPRGIAIIQPGAGFGGNYTDYCDPEALFARSVRATGSAMPEFMLNGGNGYRSYYDRPVWEEEYGSDLGWLPGQPIHVWGRAT